MINGATQMRRVTPISAVFFMSSGVARGDAGGLSRQSAAAELR